eukprot:3035757-Prymnesium_polylepis.2
MASETITTASNTWTGAEESAARWKPLRARTRWVAAVAIKQQNSVARTAGSLGKMSWKPQSANTAQPKM